MTKEMRHLKKGVMLNRINGMVPSGQDPTLLTLQPLSRKGRRDFFSLIQHHKPKFIQL